MRTQPTTHKDAGSASVLTKATLRAAELLGLSSAALAQVLGVSGASVSRLGGRRQIDPASHEGQCAILLVRVFRGLDALVGGADNCRAWLRAQNTDLGGIPAELIRTVQGLVHVSQYLDAMRGKV